MAGWGKGRALLLALLAAVAVLALAVSLVRSPERAGAGAVDGQSGVHAADLTIGPEHATLRTLDEATPRRWPDGRAGRLVAWLFAVLVAATAATTGSRRYGVPGLVALPATWPVGRHFAPRAPPFLVRPL